MKAKRCVVFVLGVVMVFVLTVTTVMAASASVDNAGNPVPVKRIDRRRFERF